MSIEKVSASRATAGRGSDVSLDRRPGVPMEVNPPHPVGNAHWKEPERQRDPGNVLKRKGLKELTPVFGTAVPPRGVSGVMRRAAYRMPEHATAHWLVLMLADRVDAIEHGGVRGALSAVPLLAGALGAAALVNRYMRRR